MVVGARRRIGAVVVCAFALAAPAPAPAAATGRSGAPPLLVRTFSLVDRSRTIRLPDGRRVPRPLRTVVRCPAAGGPYPLIVFGHGFALTPAAYTTLLAAWADAGYVVAAPLFPLGNAHAPGGPNESDLVNQPRDLSVVISRLLELSRQRTSVLAGRIDPSRVAVAGHSDGAETALAVAYDSRYRDRRIRAAVVLSGAALPGMAPFPAHGPPLLAVQGTADPINAPSSTAAYFARALRPKFLLWLVAASHLEPYTSDRRRLAIVERATTAFLDHYLKGRPLARFYGAARRPGLTRLVADP